VKAIVGLVLSGSLACTAADRPGTETGITVGGDPISVAVVQEVARARGLSPAAASSLVALDTLHGRAVMDRQPELASYLRRVALARALSLQTIRGAREKGDAGEEELERFTQLHWWELDRPVSSRVTHVVVRVPEGDDRTKARVVATRLSHALRKAGNKERFREIAEAADGEGFELKVEDLKPVTPDGRVYDPSQPPRLGARPQRYAQAFAEGANAIANLGEVSDVVETSFGFHVLLLTERLADQRVAADERRRRLRAEIESYRARETERRLLDAARANTRIELDPAAMAHTEGLTVER
jgi:hypothetical protein